MADVTIWQPKDVAQLLKAVPQLIRSSAKQMWIDYDEEVDVLYFSFRKPQKATDSELRNDGIVIHRRGNEVVGLTIQDASTR